MPRRGPRESAALGASSLLQPPEVWRPGVQFAETTDALVPRTVTRAPAESQLPGTWHRAREIPCPPGAMTRTSARSGHSSPNNSARTALGPKEAALTPPALCTGLFDFSDPLLSLPVSSSGHRCQHASPIAADASCLPSSVLQPCCS